MTLLTRSQHQPAHSQRPRTLAAWTAGLGVIASIFLGYRMLDASLIRIVFATGWFVFIVLAYDLFIRMKQLRKGASAHELASQSAILTLVFVSLFMTHAEFAIPNGWFGVALSGLTLIFLFSALVGVRLARRARDAGPDATDSAEQAVKRWLTIHLPTLASLVAVGGLHGFVSHAHCFLAYLLLGK